MKLVLTLILIACVLVSGVWIINECAKQKAKTTGYYYWDTDSDSLRWKQIRTPKEKIVTAAEAVKITTAKTPNHNWCHVEGCLEKGTNGNYCEDHKDSSQ